MAKVNKKMTANYDKRQNEHELMMKRRDGDPKVLQRMSSGGYRRPGSRNPRKARSG